MTPQEVVITRPNHVVEDFITSAVTLFIQAWVVMLIIPVVLPIVPGYWKVFAGLWIARVLFSDTSWLYFTKPKRLRR